MVENFFEGILFKKGYSGMKWFNRFFTVFILVFIVLFCSACIHKNNTSSKKTVMPTKKFYFTQTADLPINYDSSYFIEFYNWSDHTISLENKDFIVDNINLKNGYIPNDVLDVSQCHTIPANSSCHVLLKTFNKLNGEEGSFSIALNKGEIKAVTIIKYFTSHKDSDIDMQFGAANTTFNFNRAQPISVNIPIVFNEDFYDVKVSHDHQINYQFLNCDVSHFIKKTVCILQINSQGGKQFTSIFKVTGKSSEFASDTRVILETSIVNSMNNFGNLLIGLNTNAIVANGTNNITLALANNGLGSISSLTPSIVNSGSPLSITSNSCTAGTIAPNGNCSIVITAANSTVWNVDGINIQYSDGINSNSISTPIIVKPNADAYGALNLSVSGNMVTTKVNTSSIVTITVNNPGSLSVNNILVTKLNIPSGVTQYQNTCSNTLAAGASCQYVFQYSPTAVTVLNTFSFIINGRYSYSGSPVTISNQENIQYSAINSGGYLQFSLNTMLYNLDFGNSSTQNVIVTNVGSAAVSGLSIDFSAAVVSGDYSVVPASVSYSGYQNCTTMNGSLAVGAQCVLTIQFNPQTVYFDAAVFEVDYNISGGSKSADFIAYQSNVINSGVNIVVTKSVTGASGSGTIGAPYTVNTINGNDFTVTYTYTNSGTADATYFAVSPNLSAYYTVTGTGSNPCPIGSTITLAVGASCQLQVQGLNPNLYNVAQIAGAYNFHTPGVSFRDSSNGIIILNNFGDIYINFVAFFTAQIIPTTTFNTSTGNITSKMTVTILSASSFANLSFIVYSPSSSGGSVTYTNDGSSSTSNICTLDSTVGESCYVNASYATLGNDDDALFQMTPTGGGLVSWMAVPHISALAYFYTQDGTNLKSWKLNTNYTFTQIGSSVDLSGYYASVVYQGQLLVFQSASQITAYPINNDGTLGTASTITVSPVFSSTPTAATVSNFNGSLYVSVVLSPGATAQVNTYKCGSVSGGSISCSSQTSSSSYTISNGITSMASGYNANLLFYTTANWSNVMVSTSDGTSLDPTGTPVSGSGLNAVSTSNYKLDPTLIYAKYNTIYSAGYNNDGSVGSPSSIFNCSSCNITQIFMLEAAINYQLAVPLVAIIRSGNFYFFAFDGSFTSASITANQFAMYVPLMP